MQTKKPDNQSFRHKPRLMKPEEIEIVSGACIGTNCFPPPGKNPTGPDFQSKTFP